MNLVEITVDEAPLNARMHSEAAVIVLVEAVQPLHCGVQQERGKSDLHW